MSGSHALSLVRSFIDFNAGSWPGFDLPRMNDVQFITIHNTAEPFSAVQERMRVQNRMDGRHTCFHFAVDEDRALQILPLDRVSYHAGDGVNGPGNTCSISIEICRSACYGRNADLYYRAEENASQLCAYLMREYSIPVEMLRKHQDWSGKFCPHRMLHEDRWENFIAQIGETPVLEDSYLNDNLSLHEEPIVALLDNGETRWMNFRGRSFGSVDEVIADLKARSIASVLVSAWHNVATARKFLEHFVKSGIHIEGYYAVSAYDAYWARENLVQEHFDFERYMKKG